MARFRIPALIVLFASSAVIEAVRLTSLSVFSNGDVWWHLSTGLWIFQNHAFPHSGLYSQSSGVPWIATSWGYELLLAVAYKLLGLRALLILLMCFKAALAVAAFLLAGGLRGRFWLAVLSSATVQWILGSVPPGPIFCSILLFATKLTLLLDCRRTGNAKRLIWLPPMFLLWANLDVQFVYGVALLLLFTIAEGARRFVRRFGENQPERPSALAAIMGLITGLSVAATLVTPYFYHPYAIFFTRAFSAANRYLPDFHALTFHQPQDYVLLLVTMAAFLALGLRRSRDPFRIVLLVACAVLSFHSQRDIWLIALAAIAVIGEAARDAHRSGNATDKPAWNWSTLATAGSAVLIMILAIALRIPRDRRTLLARVAQSYPVAACDYIREHRLPQPLFNSYEWGGFLTWYLPEYPVSIDSRADLYGDVFIIQYSKVMNAELPYTADPALTGAQTILLPRNSLMAQALASQPAFQVAYQDDKAVVLTRTN